MFKKYCGKIKICLCRIPKKAFSISALAAVSAAAIALTVFSVNTVKVSDGEKTVTLKTCYSDTNNLLRLANVTSYENDKVTVKQANGSILLTVLRSFPVTVNYGGEQRTVTLTGGTVAEAINLAGFELNEYDLVSLSTDAKLSKAQTIDITHIDYVTEVGTVAIPYEQTTVYSDDLTEGAVKTAAKGKNGKKLVTYRKKLVNGAIAENEIVSEQIVKNPVNKTVVVGTRKKTVNDISSIACISALTPTINIELDSNGNPVNYKKHVTVQATAYTAAPGKHCSTGVVAQTGYVAVNPKVIPYGTKMFIKSSDGKYIYGYAVAADTGGFAKKRPTNIDLYFNTKSECVKFGRRNIEVYILE